MTALLRAEVRKVRSVRTSWVLLAALVALTAVGTAEPLLNAPREAFRAPLHRQPFLSAPGLLVTVFALVAGLRAFTDEFRHGTIVPTLLVTPARERVLVAKVATAAGLGAVCALVGGAVAVLMGLGWLATEGLPVTVAAGPFAGWALRLVLVGVLWAVLGVGVGLVVRHQAAAMVGALLWLTAAEAIVGTLLPAVQRYLPGAAGRALTSAWRELLDPAAAALVLAGWAAAAVAVGAVLLQRRDAADR